VREIYWEKGTKKAQRKIYRARDKRRRTGSVFRERIINTEIVLTERDWEEGKMTEALRKKYKARDRRRKTESALRERKRERQRDSILRER